MVWERVYLFYLFLVQLARKAATAIELCPGKRALFSGSGACNGLCTVYRVFGRGNRY